jgi:hypothetical protein
MIGCSLPVRLQGKFTSIHSVKLLFYTNLFIYLLVTLKMLTPTMTCPLLSYLLLVLPLLFPPNASDLVLRHHPALNTISPPLPRLVPLNATTMTLALPTTPYSSSCTRMIPAPHPMTNGQGNVEVASGPRSMASGSPNAPQSNG